jgi:hypothetical protein
MNLFGWLLRRYDGLPAPDRSTLRRPMVDPNWVVSSAVVRHNQPYEGEVETVRAQERPHLGGADLLVPWKPDDNRRAGTPPKYVRRARHK